MKCRVFYKLWKIICHPFYCAGAWSRGAGAQLALGHFVGKLRLRDINRWDLELVQRRRPDGNIFGYFFRDASLCDCDVRIRRRQTKKTVSIIRSFGFFSFIVRRRFITYVRVRVHVSF